MSVRFPKCKTCYTLLGSCNCKIGSFAPSYIGTLVTCKDGATLLVRPS